jgi:hypothetical protein
VVSGVIAARALHVCLTAAGPCSWLLCVGQQQQARGNNEEAAMVKRKQVVLLCVLSLFGPGQSCAPHQKSQAGMLTGYTYCLPFCDLPYVWRPLSRDCFDPTSAWRPHHSDAGGSDLQRVPGITDGSLLAQISYFMGQKSRALARTSCRSKPGTCGLILVIHGLTMTASDMHRITAMDEVGSRVSPPYVVIYPQDINKDWGLPGQTEALLRRMKWFTSQYKLDPKRVHVSGFSQGGYMTQDILCKDLQQDHAKHVCSISTVSPCDSSAMSFVNPVSHGTPPACFAPNHRWPTNARKPSIFRVYGKYEKKYFK